MKKIYWIIEVAIYFYLCLCTVKAQEKHTAKNVLASNYAKGNPGFNSSSMPGSSKVTGVIKDASSGEVIEFATVALIQQETNKTIDGTTTDEKGQFILTKVGQGSYKLLVSFIGYVTYSRENIVIDGKTNLAVGTISLKTDAKMLEEIVVEDEKDLIEDRIDRIVYNAEKDITNAGGTAADVLQKVPMLSVDLDGNVQLRGSSNIRVLINNKPSSIMAGNVADALKQIPADMIKSVEVITSPSAKYDGEGTAGIINIITKKNNLKGWSGSFNSGLGTRNSSLFGGAGYRNKKFGMNLNTGGYTYYTRSENETDRENLTPQSSFLNQFSENRNFGIFNNSRINLEYDLTPTTYLATGVRYGIRYHKSDGSLATVFRDENLSVLEDFDRDIDNLNDYQSIDWNVDYIKSFAKKGQELSVLGLYSRNFGGNKYDLEQINSSGTTDYKEKNDNDSYNQEITLQTDYVHPFGKTSNLEMGAKAILRNVNSDFQLSTYDFDTQSFINNPSLSNTFDYTQNVMSGYTSWNYALKSKLEFKAGVRYEYTDITGDFISTNTNFSQNYTNWLPSIAISQEVKKGQKIKASYSRRIQRPSIFYLNPYVNYSDSKNISFGNPNLDPELTDNYELSYSIFFGRNSLNFSTYLRQTNNAISSINSIDGEGVSSTTYDNVAKNNHYGLSVFGSTQVTKKWRISGNAEIYYSQFESPEYDTNNGNITYNMHLNSSLKLPKEFSLQFFGRINGPRVTLQGTRGSFSFYMLGLRKNLWKGKGGITLGVSNFLSRTFKMKSEFNTQDFKTETDNRWYSRSLRVSFNCRFGKVGQSSRRKKKSIKNDDSKEGESGGQGGK